jgi:S-DNA-T family DNA segregation ATPase FtsK/SpoIIIE
MELGPWTECIDRLATTPGQATELLRDAVSVLKGRAEFLASAGRRTWEPAPEMPALVIIIDEYAELSEEAPEAMHYTDEIARLGRALAVTLVAATQRPTQKVMGQGAVRSQMDLRICFRVREQRDVDLILGQGMLNAGWNAHKLNAPGKFLVSDPEHDIPRRTRAYLVTDEMVAITAARHSLIPRELDQISRNAMMNASPQAPEFRPGHESAGNYGETPEDILWLALCSAPEEGWESGELMRMTGMPKTTLYRRLRDHAGNGRAYQVSHGRWRARTPEDCHDT